MSELPRTQPVPDLAPHSTPREYQHDRDQARADRLNDYSDRDTSAAVESYLRRLAHPRGSFPVSGDTAREISPSPRATAAEPEGEQGTADNERGAA